MAVKYAVIPESYFKRLQSKNTGSIINFNEPNETAEDLMNGPAEFIEEGQATNNANANDLSQLVKVFPKNLTSKAKLFLHSLQGHVNLDNLNRVLYDPDSTPGSSLLGNNLMTISYLKQSYI